MLGLGLAAVLVPGLSGAASAQAPTDHVKLDVTPADLQAISQGIMKLPCKTAAPLLLELQSQLQLQAQTPRPSRPRPLRSPKRRELITCERMAISGSARCLTSPPPTPQKFFWTHLNFFPF